MNQEEHNLQCACVKWFAYQHPELQGLLFAVPNGGARSKATAGKLKAEGVVAGVSDLILLVPKFIVVHAENNADGIECHVDISTLTCGLCIEMKTKTGRQSSEQGLWQLKVEQYGYKYAVCRSLDDFIATVEGYLNQSGESPRPVGSHD